MFAGYRHDPCKTVNCESDWEHRDTKTDSLLACALPYKTKVLVRVVQL